MRPFAPMTAILAVVLVCAAAGPASAQTREAAGSIRIERALTLSSIRSMTFVAVPKATTSGAEIEGVASASAVIEITGDPGRSYRIRLPAAIETSLAAANIGRLRVWSETAGDVTDTLFGRLNDQGRDRLHIAGDLTVPSGVSLTDLSASVPLSVDYE